MESLKEYIDFIARILEVIGVLSIFLGSICALYVFSVSVLKKQGHAFVALRQSLGQSILLGLEILIGADIISTVITEPTINSVSVLGLIILIRTFLSLSLQVELEGRFPWQQSDKTK
ncbi:hypothetical protein DTO96_100580 [Ephemeroptericola cinctiostellae]|uniref:DUF1622 domain-containing protein n=1 Tax=Ephemeroptericola cinctiostellae TaxID=2268024 RepID=A0A345D931_9BURK|nr:DUF1622 domain-containing protein [Ephemeroptericola cinctiostellae]AXF84869.1 hypothetical protein DTO96_100580 [Ephemeroptericola cinctiostellae]